MAFQSKKKEKKSTFEEKLGKLGLRRTTLEEDVIDIERIEREKKRRKRKFKHKKEKIFGSPFSFG